jgi:3-hydroxyanthranilate 3,4-dioxygenase
MGGAIMLRALQTRRIELDAAAFSAPMWGIPGLTPMAKKYVRFMTSLGAGGLFAPQVEKKWKRENFKKNPVTHDKERHARCQGLVSEEPRLALAGPTVGWVAAAADTTEASSERLMADLSFYRRATWLMEESAVLYAAAAMFTNHVPCHAAFLWRTVMALLTRAFVMLAALSYATLFDVALAGPAEKDKLQGGWIAVSLIERGQSAPEGELKKVRFTFTGDNLTIKGNRPDGKEDVAVIAEGAMIYTPAGTPHSPRFPSDAFALISERKRRPGEIDKFHWYCPKCDTLLHEEQFVVDDYAKDPVSKAYQKFFDSLEFRTCKKCDEVMPAPDAL